MNITRINCGRGGGGPKREGTRLCSSDAGERTTGQIPVGREKEENKELNAVITADIMGNQIMNTIHDDTDVKRKVFIYQIYYCINR